MIDSTDEMTVALTGFMGVGKSTVARHLARMVGQVWLDLDFEIERIERRTVGEIVDQEGLSKFREMESSMLSQVLGEGKATIISLGGGTFASESNRKMLKKQKVTTIWLEATFEHCWANISSSYRDRPLARNRKEAKELFKEREGVYCLADWHFLIRPGSNSYAVAEQIAEQAFGR